MSQWADWPREKRSGGRGSLASLVALMLPYSWLEADTYTVAGANVASFVDKVKAGTGIRVGTPAHAVVQAAVPNQAAIPTAEPMLNNQVAARVLGAQMYVSNAPASAWNLLHDGTGCDMFFVWVPTDVSSFKVNNGDDLAGNPYIGHYAGAAVLNTVVNNGVGTVFAVGAGATAVNTPVYTEIAHATAAATQYSVWTKGTVSGSGAYGLAPSAAAPGRTLGLFANPGPAFGLVGSWVCQLVFARVLTTPERSLVRSYIQQRWGVAP